MTLSLGIAAVLGCTPLHTVSPTLTPTLAVEIAPPNLRVPSIALPMHEAAIVALELLPPQPGEQWRLVSADADGWVRIWADERMLAAWPAHRGGLSDLRMGEDGSFFTAGRDGRVLRWPAGATEPDQAMDFGRPLTALAITEFEVLISDGKLIELWSREEQPKRLWYMQAHGFVAGLEISPSGDIIAAAELRQSALLSGLATHPHAEFVEAEALGIDPEQEAALRAKATLEHPEAQADFVEVWEPATGRTRGLVPQDPIARRIGIRRRDAVVVYREIHDRDNSSVVGRRLGDIATVQLELVKPWAFWNQADGNPNERGLGPNLPAGDFRLGKSEEVIVLDHFPGWASEAPVYGWRAGEGRTLAVDHHHAAIGDSLGNLRVIAWARPAEPGWLAPGESRLDLLAAAAASPTLVTATLEPRIHYRLWSFAEAGYRSVRVETPETVSGAEAGSPLYPTHLALDGQGQTLATTLSSYEAGGEIGLRMLNVADGSPEMLGLNASDNAGQGFGLGLSQDGQHLLAWLPGSPTRSWSLSAKDGWTPGRPAFAGIPRFAANGAWSAHVSGLERHIVDLHARKALVALTNDTPGSELGADGLVAIADDGTLALVQPFGGGTLERIDIHATRTRVELPGAATALTSITSVSGEVVTLIGFADGSIARLDPGASEAVPIHAGAGGRIWELTALPAHPGVFVELDERGLTLHRLVDGASLELHLADASTLGPWIPTATTLQHLGLVAIWRGGSAQPPCGILDGSRGGVQTRDSIERWPLERGPAIFTAFLAGEACGGETELSPEAEVVPELAEPAASEH